jgi:tetrahydromethanopterin S-methyltransferase subunit C
VAGIVLLSWTGTGGESIDQPGTGGTGLTVDVLAHALGFVVGLGAGAVAALQAAARVLDRVPQWAAGLIALVPLAVAWSRALGS